ncbi:MAG: heme biosynthesis HemY N-terminal domain-containing protein [Pseudomonadota bacterium]
MKRLLLLVLAAIVVAGWLGTLMARDAGYVLVSYDGSTLQTSLWVMLGLLVLIVFGGYYLIKLTRFLLQSGGSWRAWRGSRAHKKALGLTSRGVTYLHEGDYARAERFLASGAEDSGHAALNYIYAARAADALDNLADRERYLRLAVEAEPGTEQAVAVARAEMALARGQFREVLDVLEGARGSDTVTLLRSKAMLPLRDWQGLWDLMPALRKAIKNADELKLLQRRIAIERLSGPSPNDDALSIIFKSLPEELRSDPQVVLVYCDHLNDEIAIEHTIRQAMKQRWTPRLLPRYAGLGSATLAQRLKTCEAWQRTHLDDGDLQLCIGRLREQSGDKQGAMEAFRKAVDLADLPEAHAELGRLYAFEGDYKRSSESFGRALRSSPQALPAPAPGPVDAGH